MFADSGDTDSFSVLRSQIRSEITSSIHPSIHPSTSFFLPQIPYLKFSSYDTAGKIGMKVLRQATTVLWVVDMSEQEWQNSTVVKGRILGIGLHRV